TSAVDPLIVTLWLPAPNSTKASRDSDGGDACAPTAKSAIAALSIRVRADMRTSFPRLADDASGRSRPARRKLIGGNPTTGNSVSNSVTVHFIAGRCRWTPIGRWTAIKCTVTELRGSPVDAFGLVSA